MTIAFAVLLIVHGLIHLIGSVKAFGIAEVARLKRPIARPVGVLWLLAALSFVTSGALALAAPSSWWMAALPALVVSQAVIAMSWRDAKAGTVANLVVLVPLVLALLDLRASSLGSTYRREVERATARAGEPGVVTEEDLAAMPAPVQTYLRRVGVVGRPRVHDVHARWRGEMRREIGGAWMTIRAEQHDVFDPSSRFFLMQARLYGIPFEALHVFTGPSATMQVRVVSVIPMVDARGPEMNQSETVTLFNDLCLLAPAALVDADVRWEELDPQRVRASFTRGAHTVSAVLSFDASGDLSDFVSHDRFMSADGATYRNLPWSTPVRDYRDFGVARVAARGEAVWSTPEGPYVYGRFELEELEYNVARRVAR